MNGAAVKTKLDVEKIRGDFPILTREVHPGAPLVFFDSAASSQKPESVIQAMDHYYRHTHANIHRGVYTLAEEATAAYEEARKKVMRFVNTRSYREIVFTRNATESINLVAQSWGRANLKKGDVIILTEMEHHSNLVPWQMLAAEKGLQLKFIRMSGEGQLDLDQFRGLLKSRPKLVAFTQMSNVLGTINPAKEVIAIAHAAGALALVDAAQSVPHIPVDVQDMDADWIAFSAHKMCGPTGIGALYGKEALLDAMPPFLGGGDMIKRVYLDTFSPNELPHKFEAGTPAIAEAVGFGAAVDYLNAIGMEAVAAHEQELIAYALGRLETVPGLTVYGPAAGPRGGVASFSMEGIHPHDVAQILDMDGIAVRAGHHCAMPLHDRLNLTATTRASFYIYSTTGEIDKLIAALYKVNKTFGM